MNFQKNCKKVFVDKGYTSKLYSWSPECPDFTRKNKTGNQSNNIYVRPTFCSATPGSQGQDWVTTYVYTLSIVDNTQARLAYVECDYVE